MRKNKYKESLILVYLLFLGFGLLESNAQNGQVILPYWPDSVFVPSYNLSFRVPSVPATYTDHNQIMYSIEVDSTLALQTQLFDSAYFMNNNVLVDSALIYANGDTMAAMALIFASATNSNVSMSATGSISNRNYRDIGLEYQTLGSDLPYRSYIRFFYFNKRFMAFAVTGDANDDARLVYYRDLFFPSIKFY